MSKRTSTYLKAFAILFMLATHFLDYHQPANLLTIQFSNGRNLDSYIGYAAGICVAMFAFLNGYGLTASLEKKNPLSKFLYLLKKGVVFLLEYWFIVFTLFLPFYLVSGNTMDVGLFFRTLIGYGGIHGFAWYVWFFLIVLVLIPFLPLLFPKKAHWSVGLLAAYVPMTIVILVWTILDKNDACDAIRGYTIHFISVLGGAAFYRYGIFEKVRSLLGKAKLDKWWFYLIFTILGLGLKAIFRKGIIAPYVLIPLLFLIVAIFEDHNVPKWLDFGLSWLVRLSMALWFIHYAFFAGYVNQIIPLFDIVSGPRVGVAIVLLALVMCLPVALAYHFIFKGVGCGFNQLVRNDNQR